MSDLSSGEDARRGDSAELSHHNTAFLLWLLRRRRRAHVNGPSMLPTLQPGDDVLYDPRAYRAHPPAPGDIVVLRHPARPALKLIKRVRSVQSDGAIWVEGDNAAASDDSRTFGPVSAELILGRVDSLFG